MSGERVAAGVAVQVLEASKPSAGVGRDLEQAHGLAGARPTADLHQLGRDPDLAGPDECPPGDRLARRSRPGACELCRLRCQAGRRGVDRPGVGLADLIQEQQRVTAAAGEPPRRRSPWSSTTASGCPRPMPPRARPWSFRSSSSPRGERHRFPPALGRAALPRAPRRSRAPTGCCRPRAPRPRFASPLGCRRGRTAAPRRAPGGTPPPWSRRRSDRAGRTPGRATRSMRHSGRAPSAPGGQVGVQRVARRPARRERGAERQQLLAVGDAIAGEHAHRHCPLVIDAVAIRDTQQAAPALAGVVSGLGSRPRSASPIQSTRGCRPVLFQPVDPAASDPEVALDHVRGGCRIGSAGGVQIGAAARIAGRSAPAGGGSARSQPFGKSPGTVTTRTDSAPAPIASSATYRPNAASLVAVGPDHDVSPGERRPVGPAGGLPAALRRGGHESWNRPPAASAVFSPSTIRTGTGTGGPAGRAHRAAAARRRLLAPPFAAVRRATPTERQLLFLAVGRVEPRDEEQ